MEMKRAMPDERSAASRTRAHRGRRYAYLRLTVLAVVIAVAVYAAFRLGIF